MKQLWNFFFSPDVGIDCLGLGRTGDQLVCPDEDPYEQVRASISRFNWCCHAEDFFMPLTGYVLKETSEGYANKEPDKPPLEQMKENTIQSKIHKSLAERGYTVTKEISDGTQPVIVIDSTAEEPGENDPPVEYSAGYMAAKGFTPEDYENVRKIFGIEESDKDDPKYKESDKDGLMVDKNEAPLLPIVVKPNQDKMAMYNYRSYRPAEAWRAINMDPPVRTNKADKRYIPWPKLGDYG